MYVEELIGPDTVNTMPEETIKAYQDHGRPEPRLERELEGARRVFTELAEVGVDYKDVTDTLEREGVEKFSDAFDELLAALARSASRWRRLTGCSGVGHRDQHADRQRPRREGLGVDRDDAEAPGR